MENLYLISAFTFITGFAIGFLINKVMEKNKPSSELKHWQNKYFESEKMLAEFKAKISTFETMQKQTEIKFENLANKILESSSEKLSKESEKNLATLLNPLKEQINSFKERIEKTTKEASIERSVLNKQILNLADLNNKLTQEADNLTKALKGDTKAQGNWGEVVLEKILETSGLREGEEYILQGKDLKLKTDDGRHLKPDVIINLPDKKHVIIDSKVSLLHYEKYSSSENKEEKGKYLSLFLNSVREHIKNLDSKKYQHNEALGSPDFVLMFMPIEGAFSLAIQNDNELFSFAWDRSIVLVSPTNLIAILKTIESLWKLDSQNKNTIEIARQSGDLYDKFVGFVDDLKQIGYTISKANEAYDGAMNKLTTGKGNLITRAEKIKKLGAKAKKELPEELKNNDDTKKLF